MSKKLDIENTFTINWECGLDFDNDMYEVFENKNFVAGGGIPAFFESQDKMLAGVQAAKPFPMGKYAGEGIGTFHQGQVVLDVESTIARAAIEFFRIGPAFF